MATVPGDSGGVVSTGTMNVKNQPTQSVDSRAFLLLLGQVIAVLIAAWLASTFERVGYIVVAFFAVLWLMFLMNRSDLIASWGAKLGLPSLNYTTAVK